MILASMGVMVGFIGASMRLLKSIQVHVADRSFSKHQFFIVASAAVILVLTANTICVWIWAALFLTLGVFPTLEEAVYFSIVSFTTVGYGDVVVDKNWRILSGFVSVNGLLAFGIFTAFLIQVMREISSRVLHRI
ncbi:MAG: ion channel [Pseudomonadota bacterium]